MRAIKKITHITLKGKLRQINRKVNNEKVREAGGIKRIQMIILRNYP